MIRSFFGSSISRRLGSRSRSLRVSWKLRSAKSLIWSGSLGSNRRVRVLDKASGMTLDCVYSSGQVFNLREEAVRPCVNGQKSKSLF